MRLLGRDRSRWSHDARCHVILKDFVNSSGGDSFEGSSFETRSFGEKQRDAYKVWRIGLEMTSMEASQVTVGRCKSVVQNPRPNLVIRVSWRGFIVSELKDESWH